MYIHVCAGALFVGTHLVLVHDMYMYIHIYVVCLPEVFNVHVHVHFCCELYMYMYVCYIYGLSYSCTCTCMCIDNGVVTYHWRLHGCMYSTLIVACICTYTYFYKSGCGKPTCGYSTAVKRVT